MNGSAMNHAPRIARRRAGREKTGAAAARVVVSGATGRKSAFAHA